MGEHEGCSGGRSPVCGILNTEHTTKYIVIDCVGRTPVRGNPVIVEHNHPICKQRRQVEIGQHRDDGNALFGAL
jgi:hypothetical protein